MESVVTARINAPARVATRGAAAQLGEQHGRSSLTAAAREQSQDTLKLGAIMEDLPPDLALVILNKLAAQDPLSLLRALCASDALFCTVDKNMALWLKVLLALGPSTDLPKLHGRCQKLSAKFEAEMVSLGVCKQLVVAQLAKLKGPGCEQIRAISERTVAHGLQDLQGPSLGRPSTVLRFVFLIRVQGRLLLWQIFTRRPRRLVDYIGNIFDFLSFSDPPRSLSLYEVNLGSVYADVTVEQILELVGSPESKGPHLLKTPVTLEVHRVLDEGEYLDRYPLMSSEVYKCECEKIGRWGSFLNFKIPPTSTIDAVTVRTPRLLIPSQGELLAGKFRKALHEAKMWFLAFVSLVILFLVLSAVVLAVLAVLALLLYGLYLLISFTSKVNS